MGAKPSILNTQETSPNVPVQGVQEPSGGQVLPPKDSDTVNIKAGDLKAQINENSDIAANAIGNACASKSPAVQAILKNVPELTTASERAANAKADAMNLWKWISYPITRLDTTTSIPITSALRFNIEQRHMRFYSISGDEDNGDCTANINKTMADFASEETADLQKLERYMSGLVNSYESLHQ